MQYRHYDFPASLPQPARPPRPASVGFGSWLLIIVVVVLVSAAVTIGAMWFMMRQGGGMAPPPDKWAEPDENWGEAPSMPEAPEEDWSMPENGR